MPSAQWRWPPSLESAGACKRQQQKGRGTGRLTGKHGKLRSEKQACDKIYGVEALACRRQDWTATRTGKGRMLLTLFVSLIVLMNCEKTESASASTGLPGAAQAYSLKHLPLIWGHLGRGVVDHVVDAGRTVRLKELVDGGAVLRVPVVHLLADVLEVGLHVRDAVDELLHAGHALRVVWT